MLTLVGMEAIQQTPLLHSNAKYTMFTVSGNRVKDPQKVTSLTSQQITPTSATYHSVLKPVEMRASSQKHQDRTGIILVEKSQHVVGLTC